MVDIKRKLAEESRATRGEGNSIRWTWGNLGEDDSGREIVARGIFVGPPNYEVQLLERGGTYFLDMYRPTSLRRNGGWVTVEASRSVPRLLALAEGRVARLAARHAKLRENDLVLRQLRDSPPQVLEDIARAHTRFEKLVRAARGVFKK